MIVIYETGVLWLTVRDDTTRDETALLFYNSDYSFTFFRAENVEKREYKTYVVFKEALGHFKLHSPYLYTGSLLHSSYVLGRRQNLISFGGGWGMEKAPQ